MCATLTSTEPRQSFRTDEQAPQPRRSPDQHSPVEQRAVEEHGPFDCGEVRQGVRTQLKSALGLYLQQGIQEDKKMTIYPVLLAVLKPGR